MSSFILGVSMIAMLQAPPDIKYERLVHVMSGSNVLKVVPLPYNGPSDLKYVLVLGQDEPIQDDEIIYEALNNCRNANRKRTRVNRRAREEALLLRLLEIEKSYGVPNSLRGMLLAAACHESGYNPNALGDRKFSKSRKAMAHGLFQMWPWWERVYHVNRTHPIQSAHAYMKHIVRQTSKVRKNCGKRHSKNIRKRWITGWVTAIRSPKATGRCREQPRFYRIVKNWHRSIKAHRKQVEECTGNETDGCGC